MPKVNIYLSMPKPGYANDRTNNIKKMMSRIKNRIAKTLSCPEIKLSKNHISIRIILDMCGHNNGMIAPVEIDIHAQSFPKRIENRDKISTDLAKYFRDRVFHSKEKPSVLLILSELGTG